MPGQSTYDDEEEQQPRDEFKTQARVDAEESAAKYDQTASNLATKYKSSSQKREEAKSRASRVKARERVSTSQEGSEDDEDDGPGPIDRMVAGAKHIPEAIQSSLQSASAVIKRKKTSEIGDKETAPAPPSRVLIDADDSEEGESAATKLKEALAELGKRTRDASSDLFDGIKKLASQDRTIMTVSKRDFQQKPCPQILLQCCTVLVCKGLTMPSVFKTASIPPEAVKKHVTQLGSSFVVSDSMDPRMAAAVIKHFLASLDDPLLCKKLADEWVGMSADPSFVKLVLVDLPPANLATLQLLMETCHRIAAHSETTGMDAQALATELVPVLLWRSPAPGATSQTGSMSEQRRSSQMDNKAANEEEGKVEKSRTSKRSTRDEDDDVLVGYHLANTSGLNGKRTKEGGTADRDSEEPGLNSEEFEAVVKVVTHMITNYEECFQKAEVAP